MQVIKKVINSTVAEYIEKVNSMELLLSSISICSCDRCCYDFSNGSKFVQCRYILEFHFHLVLNLCNVDIYLGISFSFGSKFVRCRYILEFHFHLVLNLCDVDISWNFIFIWF